MKAWGVIPQKVDGKILWLQILIVNLLSLIGAEIDRTDKGLGIRSARYTMLVENNVVTKN